MNLNQSADFNKLVHDLRTPLATIASTARVIQKYLPKILEAYQQAQQAEASVPHIRSHQFKFLEESCQVITDEVKQINELLNQQLEQGHRG